MLYCKKMLCIFLDQLPAGWGPECNVGHATLLEPGAEPVLKSPVVLMRIQVELSLACLMLHLLTLLNLSLNLRQKLLVKLNLKLPLGTLAEFQQK